MPLSIDSGKFKQPPLPDTAIDRPELMEVFERGFSRRVLFISAAAGCGKTVAAIQYLRHKGLSATWINLDEYDNTPAAFCELLLTALTGVFGTAAARALGTPDFALSPIECVIKTVSGFTLDGGHALLLDGFHAIDNADILRALPDVIKRMPDKLWPVILSRSAPVGLSDMALKGQLAVIKTDELRFTEYDVSRFYKKMGLRLTAGESESVLRRTNGWAAAVNVLAFSHSPDAEGAPDYSVLYPYIETGIWRQLDDRHRAFLLGTSLADELDPQLCELLTGERDSAALLEGLSASGLFLSRMPNRRYRHHELFKGFLATAREAEGIDENAIYRQMAGWCFEKGDFRRAADYCLVIGDFDGFNAAASQMNRYNTQYSSAEAELEYISTRVMGSIPDAAIAENGLLLMACAYACYLRGDGHGFEGYLDKLYARVSAGTHPEPAEPLMLMRTLDYRVPLLNICSEAATLTAPLGGGKLTNSKTLGQNLPFFHRSVRDYSEVQKCRDGLRPFDDGLGRIIGRQYGVLRDCILAGLAYERGLTDDAFEYAVSAGAQMEPGFPSEVKFQAFMILLETLYARGSKTEAARTEKYVADMIEADSAHYLRPNFSAYLYRRRIRERDVGSAGEWLGRFAVNPYTPLSFYEIYRHFTTVRAYILAGEYGSALMLIARLIALAGLYARPLDILEARVLKSVVLWKERKYKISVDAMEQAVLLAFEYGYTRAFTDECVDTEIILHRLYNQSIQNKAMGADVINYVKRLHHMVYEQAGGTSAARTLPQKVKLSRQQTRIMKILANGRSYQQVAAETGLSISTVKTHIKGAYLKLGVSNAKDAMVRINDMRLFEQG